LPASSFPLCVSDYFRACVRQRRHLLLVSTLRWYPVLSFFLFSPSFRAWEMSSLSTFYLNACVSGASCHIHKQFFSPPTGSSDPSFVGVRAKGMFSAPTFFRPAPVNDYGTPFFPTPVLFSRVYAPLRSLSSPYFISGAVLL